MIEVFNEIAKSSPAVALAGVALWLVYKLAMRALDALEANTKALAALEAQLEQDRRERIRA
jgi:hypothetical protein|tara:strand:+ start:221 stop:403 length:183 start_codon:yes stop_codon:yes gene_type:complete